MASRILVKNIAIEKGGIVDKRKIIKLIQHLSDLFYSKIPEMGFWGQVVLWRPGVPRPKNTRFLKMCGFVGLGTPGLQKNTWPKNGFGIPLITSALGPTPAQNRGTEKDD